MEYTHTDIYIYKPHFGGLSHLVANSGGILKDQEQSEAGYVREPPLPDFVSPRPN